MKTLHIATACFLNADQELLVVRKQNTSAWMLPGGKLDGQETPAQALVRELQEEIQVTITEDSLTPLGTFDAVAANEALTAVHSHAYVAKIPEGQQPTISAEIAEMRWLPLHGPLPDTLAPLLEQHIIPALNAAA